MVESHLIVVQHDLHAGTVVFPGFVEPLTQEGGGSSGGVRDPAPLFELTHRDSPRAAER